LQIYVLNLRGGDHVEYAGLTGRIVTSPKNVMPIYLVRLAKKCKQTYYPKREKHQLYTKVALKWMW